MITDKEPPLFRFLAFAIVWIGLSFAFLWAVNELFNAGIELTFLTVLAAMVIVIIAW